MEEIEIEVTNEQEGERLDKYLASQIDSLSRAYIQKLLEEERVSVNGVTAKKKEIVKAGDYIEFSIPDPEGLSIQAEKMQLSIIYEDGDLIVIDKPKGMVVHPAAGHFTGTLVNGLLYHCGASLSGINGVLRPGIVHRIDKDTTGVLVVCKNDIAHRDLAEQFKIHSITRIYDAIVYGSFSEDKGRVEGNIQRSKNDRLKMAVSSDSGKYAATNFSVVETFGKRYTQIKCQLETGRTHQIRVHMSSIGHPLLGDTVYGPKKDPFHLNGQALHAGVLGFRHPTTHEYMEFSSPLPEYFQELQKKLSNETIGY